MRELREELAETVRVERLVWVVENFFTHAGRPHHELGLYYLVTLPPDSPRLDLSRPFRGQEHGIPLIFRWFPQTATSRLPIYPVFLRAALQAIPAVIQHIVNEDSRDEDSRAGGAHRQHEAHTPDADSTA